MTIYKKKNFFSLQTFSNHSQTNSTEMQSSSLNFPESNQLHDKSRKKEKSLSPLFKPFQTNRQPRRTQRQVSTIDNLQKKKKEPISPPLQISSNHHQLPTKKPNDEKKKKKKENHIFSNNLSKPNFEIPFQRGRPAGRQQKACQTPPLPSPLLFSPKRNASHAGGKKSKCNRGNDRVLSYVIESVMTLNANEEGKFAVGSDFVIAQQNDADYDDGTGAPLSSNVMNRSEKRAAGFPSPRETRNGRELKGEGKRKG